MFLYKVLLKRFFILIISFIALQTICYIIPNTWIENNVFDSLSFVQDEGNSLLFTHKDGSVLDYFTDRLMLQQSLTDNTYTNPLFSAINANGYNRYWHGYLVVLRPLLVFFSIGQIRYINAFIMLLLSCIIFSKMKQNINFQTAFCFILSLSMSYFIIIPNCLQFCAVYYIMLFSVNHILSSEQKYHDKVFLLTLFLTIGMLTNYFDFLTAPLLTLGIPITLILLWGLNDPNYSLILNIKILLQLSITWGIGYALTWLSKWILSLLLLGPDTLRTVIQESQHRLVGNQEEALNRFQMLTMNIRNFIPPIYRYDDKVYMHIFISLCAIVFMLLIFFMVRYGQYKLYIKRVLPFILVALYPYIWFNVMANHSQIHNFYTYRIQMISVFAILSSYSHFLFNPERTK